MTTMRTPAQRAVRRHLLAGLTMVLMMTAGVGGWAATTPLAGAVIAGGVLVVDSYVKKVQHPSGGIVGSLTVKDGDHVEAGDVLIRLDQTQTKANLAIVEKRLIELDAAETRLAAERDGKERVAFDATFDGRLDDPDVAKAMRGETRLFEARRSLRAGQTNQLTERIAQLDEEMKGLEVQIVGKDREIDLIRQEAAGVRILLEKGLTQLPRFNGLQREAARLTSERGMLVASIAQAKGKVAETQLQVLQINEDLAQEVAKELREIEATIGEFTERRVAAEDQLKRIDIRAPQSGTVHELIVHAAGAVIAPGETIMLIVPTGDRLEAEVRIAAQDIDQLTIGQKVNLRFSAFNQRTTPEITGTLERVGADLTHEAQTGRSFYVARVAIGVEELGKLGDLHLVPGMPVEAFVTTGDRTALSYLVKPLQDQIERSFKEN